MWKPPPYRPQDSERQHLVKCKHGPIITGTVVISGTTGSLINATAKMGNETISGVTATLVKPSIDK